ncbi:hypothetical protein Bbelb_412420 [Branchiostoma belcheri]|nr:hypothetical protein Bbelb_412420 [Branchiostoma belcheri]
MPILLEKEKTFTPFALGCLKQTHVERTDFGSPREESSYGIRGPISQGLRGAPLRYQLTMLAPNRASPVVGNSVAPLKSESDDVIWARQSPVHSGHRGWREPGGPQCALLSGIPGSKMDQVDSTCGETHGKFPGSLRANLRAIHGPDG